MHTHAHRRVRGLADGSTSEPRGGLIGRPEAIAATATAERHGALGRGVRGAAYGNGGRPRARAATRSIGRAGTKLGAGEEQGLYGSKAFVDHYGPRLGGATVINVDMVGHGTGASYAVTYNEGTARAVSIVQAPYPYIHQQTDVAEVARSDLLQRIVTVLFRFVDDR